MCQMKDVNSALAALTEPVPCAFVAHANNRRRFDPRELEKKVVKVVKKMVGFWLSVGVRVRTRHGRKENHVLFLDNVRITRAFSFLVFHPGLPKITQDLCSSETCKSAHGFYLYKEVKERFVPGCAF